MRFGVVTLFPEMFAPLSGGGIVGRAIRAGLLQVRTWNPRDYAPEPQCSVDDRPYGGGPGMVLMAPPLRAALAAARAGLGPEASVIYLSPQGRRLDQRGVAELARRPALLLLAGRHEGVDERLIALEVEEEWSIGDYVLSGGEPAALVLIDAVTRLLPGALGHEAAASEDSFAADLLEYPQYTRPREVEGLQVPEVLLSGDHDRIRRWRLCQALGRTWQRRPELLLERELDAEQRELLAAYLCERPIAGQEAGR